MMKKLLLILAFLSLTLCTFAQFTFFQNLSYSTQFGSCKWFDADEDGDMDFFITGPSQCVIYNNNGTSMVANAFYTGQSLSGSDCGDYDNDGDLDFIYNGAISGTRYTRLLRCNGGFSYSMLNNISFGTDTSCQFGDYDNDGDLDILFTGVGVDRQALIYRNDGNGNFTNTVSFPSMVYNAGIWCDTDNDGDLDVVIIGLWGSATDFFLYRNDGNYG